MDGCRGLERSKRERLRVSVFKAIHTSHVAISGTCGWIRRSWNQVTLTKLSKEDEEVEGKGWGPLGLPWYRPLHHGIDLPPKRSSLSCA